MIHSEEQTFPKQNSSKIINYAILTLFFLDKMTKFNGNLASFN